jgi:hypothetical protein
MKVTRAGLTVPFSAIVVCALAFLPSNLSQAQIQTLADNNSTILINPNSQQGMFSWSVDGAQQLFQQWFWYRLGAVGGESSIDTISAPSILRPTANSATLGYNNAGYNLSVVYNLSGGNAGSGASSLTEQITFNNTSTGGLTLHFFQYSDFDLAGNLNGDTVTLGKNPLGLFNYALQTKGSVALSETSVTPGANHGEANTYPNTLNSLNDANPTTLSDNAGPITGDATWAFEWDTTVNPGGSFIISKVLTLQVPEPSSLALLSLGLAACALYRRRSA